MKKLLVIILSVLVIQITAGCEKEQETLDRIIEHIIILEEELPAEDKEYLAESLIDIKTGVLPTSPSGEHPKSLPGLASWYNRHGKLDESFVSASDELLYVSRELIMKHTDGKLIGQYYVDENFQVYYFGGRGDGE